MSLELIAYLLTWAVFYTGYPSPDMPPTIEYVPHSHFVREMCNFVDTIEDPCNIRAMYNDDIDGVIFLDEILQRKIDAHIIKSIVVHEMVHYLQDLTGAWKDINKWQIDIQCQEKAFRQREAYIAQDKYMLDVHGVRRLYPRVHARCGEY